MIFQSEWIESIVCCRREGRTKRSSYWWAGLYITSKRRMGENCWKLWYHRGPGTDQVFFSNKMFVYTLYNKENLFSKYQVNLYEFEDRKIFSGGAGLGGF